MGLHALVSLKMHDETLDIMWTVGKVQIQQEDGQTVTATKEQYEQYLVSTYSKLMVSGGSTIFPRSDNGATTIVRFSNVLAVTVKILSTDEEEKESSIQDHPAYK